jgi:hypothetical protein
MPAAAACPGYWMTGFEASELDSPDRCELLQNVGFAANFGEIRSLTKD